MRKITLTLLILFISFTGLYSQGKTIVSLTGSIKNELSKDPIGIEIRVFNSQGKQLFIVKSNSKDGYYFMTGLKPDSTYYLRFNDFSYFADSHEFVVPNTTKYQEYSKDFLVTPKKEGMKFPVKVPPFDIGKSKLRSGSEFFLNEILRLMNLNKRVEFLIKVYPDNAKDQDFNLTLTTERAKSLEEYFVKNGIENHHFKIEGSREVDSENPPPSGKQAKGKKYIGSIYLQVTKI
jgi:hypothetical protein